MSSPFSSELTELAAPHPGFQISAPQELAAPGVSAHASGGDRASRVRGAQAPGRLSGLSRGPGRVVPRGGAPSSGLHALRPRSGLSLHGVASADPDPGLPGEEQDRSSV